MGRVEFSSFLHTAPFLHRPPASSGVLVSFHSMESPDFGCASQFLGLAKIFLATLIFGPKMRVRSAKLRSFHNRFVAAEKR